MKLTTFTDYSLHVLIRLERLLGEAVHAFRAVLDRCTLADLAAQPQALEAVLRLQAR
jgi:DNA-binding IscR family transcriptional regulator